MPENESFLQCVHYFFGHEWLEKGYTMANLFFLYGLPLAVIIYCYSAISCVMIKRGKAQASNNVDLRVIQGAAECSGKSEARVRIASRSCH